VSAKNNALGISAALRTYNCSIYVVDQVRSILSQTRLPR